MIFKKQICYDDFINISNNVINAILLFNEDKQAKIGDSFELTYDYKTINAKIVQIKKYKNYLIPLLIYPKYQINGKVNNSIIATLFEFDAQPKYMSFFTNKSSGFKVAHVRYCSINKLPKSIIIKAKSVNFGLVAETKHT